MDRTELGAWAPIVNFPEDRWNKISEKVESAYETQTVYPPRENIFAALQTTPPERLKVVILGQDPYHEPGQAHGLSFSVTPGTPLPKSLINIYKELESDMGIAPAESGCLLPWAEQGVLLLNSVLTVQEHAAGSHKSFGWEKLTDAVIKSTNQLPQPVVFILWGGYAIKKAELIDSEYPRLVLTSVHPSPLSAYRGFFGSRPFSKANAFLTEQGSIPIDWRIEK